MVVDDSDRSTFVTGVTLYAQSFLTVPLLLVDIITSACPFSAAMFTLKATYRSETRKFTFSDSSFPTYNQIHEQVLLLFLLIFPF